MKPEPPQASTPNTTPDSARVLGLDAARAIAVIGMIAVNVGPSSLVDPVDNVWEWVYALPHGRASILFVVLAGIGITLLTRRSRSQHGPTSGAVRWSWVRIGWRALVLLVLGLTLQLLDHDVNVILQVYAVLFLVGGLLMRASDAALLGVSAAGLIVGPLLWIQFHTEDVAPASWASPPGELVTSLVVTGPYPLVTWLAPFVFGMWLGRRPLAHAKVQGRMVCVGLAAAAVAVVVSAIGTRTLYDDADPIGWSLLVTDGAHGQMPLWTISSTGLAVMVLGMALWLTPRFTRLLRPLIATGQLALTVYVLHLVVLIPIRPAPENHTTGALITLAIALGCVVFSLGWRRLWQRGPVEELLRIPDLVRGRSRPG